MNRVKELRVAQRKSQQHLAEVAGVSRQAIAKYENEESTPGGSVAVRLAVELGVSVPYLLGTADTPQRADSLPPGWVQAVENWIAMGLTPDHVRQAVRSWQVARGQEPEGPRRGE